MPNGEYSGFEKPRLAAEASDFRSIIRGLSCAARAGPRVHLGAAEGGISPGSSIESDVDKVDQYCDDYCGVVGMKDCYNYAGVGESLLRRERGDRSVTWAWGEKFISISGLRFLVECERCLTKSWDCPCGILSVCDICIASRCRVIVCCGGLTF